MARAARDEMTLEPVARQLRHHVQSSGLFEEVRCTRDRAQIVIDGGLFPCRAPAWGAGRYWTRQCPSALWGLSNAQTIDRSASFLKSAGPSVSAEPLRPPDC